MKKDKQYHKKFGVWYGVRKYKKGQENWSGYINQPGVGQSKFDLGTPVKDEARKLLLERIEEIFSESDTLQPAKKFSTNSVNTVLDAYLESYKLKLIDAPPEKQKRLLSSKSALCKHLRNYFSDKSVFTLDKQMIDDYITDRKRSGSASGSIMSQIQTLKAAINKVLKNGQAAAVLAKLEGHITLKKGERDVIIPPDHWQQILETLPEYMKLCCEITQFIGARPAEIRDLTWDQFDEVNGRLNFTAEQVKEDQPKSLKLNERLTMALIELKVDQKRKDIPFIFRNVSGQGRLNQNQYYAGWKQTMQELGFVDGENNPLYHPHDMRRTRVTQLLDAGENIATVMKQTGHKRPDILLKIYNRSNHEKQDSMVERIDGQDQKLLEEQQLAIKAAEERQARVKEYLKNQYWTVDMFDDLDKAKKEFKSILDGVMDKL